MNLTKWLTPEALLPRGMAHEDLPSGGSMLKEYVALALPSVMEMVLISLVNMVDTAMVSTVGTDAGAAVGIVGQPRMIMLSLFLATNMGITAVVARRRGEERREDANTVMRSSMVLIVALSFVLMAVLMPLARPLMRFAGAEEGRTLDEATDYFRILGWVLPLNALSMGICAAQRGVGNTKLTMYVNIASNLVNILFNWLLINGVGPFPKLGVRGAAIATAIGIGVGFVLCMVSLAGGYKHGGFLAVGLRDDWRPKKEALRDVLRVASSSMLEQLAFRVGFFSYAKIVASLGTDAFAAHQIANQFLGLSFSFADGFGIAGTSLVGQMLGRKRKDLSYIYGRLAQRFALAVSIALAAFCALLRGPLVSMFITENANPGVRETAEMLMIIVAAFQPFQMVQVVTSGALRGAGDVKYTARVMLLTVLLVRPTLSLLGIWAARNVFDVPDLAIAAAWVAAIIDMIVRQVLVERRYRSGKWQDIRV